MEALKAAYTYGEQWLEQCIEYIYNNFIFLDKYLKENIPQISLVFLMEHI